MRRLLAADIGGTKTVLQIVEMQAGGRKVCARLRLANAGWPDFESLLQRFFDDHPQPTGSLCAAVIAVAGPVERNTVQLTNLPWHIRADTLASRFAIPHVSIINDFAAVALSADTLKPGDVAVLQPGNPVMKGVRGFIGAGTGLGHALAVYGEDGYITVPSEAGHTDCAARTPQEADLLAWCRQFYPHVSWERLVSGPGIALIARYFTEQQPGDAGALRQALQAPDPGEAISALALQQHDPLALRALEVFLGFYGAQAGNLALTARTEGGLYIAGGIAPKILPLLSNGVFLEAFLAKGRFAGWMERVPVKVILHPEPGLLGATEAASRLCYRAANVCN